MDLKGAVIVNRYYSDNGLRAAVTALCGAFEDCGVTLQIMKTPINPLLNAQSTTLDFAVFYDKDIYAAKQLEQNKVKVFNNSFALSVCDDKIATYQALKNIAFPKTVCVPLKFKSGISDGEFCGYVSDNFCYPVVLKQNRGSLGEQVQLIENSRRLQDALENSCQNAHVQEFVRKSAGRDVRVYVVGHKAIGCIGRANEKDFRSNLNLGGTNFEIENSGIFLKAAEKISRMLRMDFGAVDFLDTDPPLFLEANANAYLNSVMRFDAPKKIAQYVLGKVYASKN